MRRWQTGLLMILAVFLISAPPAFAAEQEGSVCIELPDLESHNSQRKGVEFNFWKVGQVDEDGLPVFDAVYEISSYPTTASGLEEAAKLAAKKVEGQPLITIWTDADGRACAEHMDRGLYLIMAAEKNPYGEVSPFLVPVPYLDGKTGTLFYEITAEPKASPYEDEEPEESNPPAPSNPSHPAGGAQTGDIALAERYLLFAVLSLSAIAGILIYGREKRKKQREGQEKE